jgi:hypothetical protein
MSRIGPEQAQNSVHLVPFTTRQVSDVMPQWVMRALDVSAMPDSIPTSATNAPAAPYRV